ncbi:hypothetical protein GJ496_003939 [Pomphorhynchus laevis]|nr:hypothetical protein GJ496_003939 [Pomphorhynchus laevis]
MQYIGNETRLQFTTHLNANVFRGQGLFNIEAGSYVIRTNFISQEMRVLFSGALTISSGNYDTRESDLLSDNMQDARVLPQSPNL